MHNLQKELQLQYQGFLTSHFLWENSNVFLFKNINYKKVTASRINLDLEKKLRLGKLVERFVFEEIRQDPSIEILAENIQIQNNKTTVGELDCLLLQNGIPTHLEIVYKFYLYDASVGSTEIDHWIGPNRRDSFVQKLTKLYEKQFPLLYHEKTKSYLEELNISSKDIIQKAYFKAQLFVPLADFGKNYPLINSDCIEGFYIYENELQQFSNCKFFIPTKHNWLAKPHPQISWLTYKNFSIKISEYLSEKNAPLCWMKKPNGKLVKFFVVWWNVKRC